MTIIGTLLLILSLPLRTRQHKLLLCDLSTGCVLGTANDTKLPSTSNSKWWPVSHDILKVEKLLDTFEPLWAG